MGEENIFRPVYRELSDEEKQLMSDVKDKAQELLLLIESTLSTSTSPKKRYVDYAEKALEEAVMWGVKAITT